MMRVLLDINVVLDLLLNRPPRAADMAVIWDAHRLGKIDAALAAFSLPTIFYIVRKQTDLPTARKAVQACLSTLTIASVDRATLIAAETLAGPDFEDDLQIACAMGIGASAIVTRDPKGFAHAPISVLTPADLVVKLSSTTP